MLSYKGPYMRRILFMIPLGLEPRTFCIFGRHVNHHTIKPNRVQDVLQINLRDIIQR